MPIIGEILMQNDIEIGIFGGTGVYDSGFLQDSEELVIDTPFGKTSDSITVGIFKEKKIAFLPRHGKKHTIPPHMINYKANIWAFKELGIKRIIAPSAVGSLKEEIKPGDFVLPSQFLDFTKSREGSFSKNDLVIHISVADPFCSELQDIIWKTSQEQNVSMHKDCTYVCIQGPRFSTKAESKFFKSIGADIIGMTLVPECQLAREAQICYASISTVTDYDVWAEKPVTAKEVIETLSKNVESTKKILSELISKIPKTRNCVLSTLIRKPSAISDSTAISLVAIFGPLLTSIFHVPITAFNGILNESSDLFVLLYSLQNLLILFLKMNVHLFLQVSKLIHPARTNLL